MTEEKTELINICKFLAEVGVLKRLPLTGLKLAGVVENEFIAMHVVRAAQLAYILAELEGANPEKTACMVLFHDNGETRVGDQHKVAARYFDIKKAEQRAFVAQIQNLPASIQRKLKGYYSEYKQCGSLEGIVAKDADWLETAISCKELMEQGASASLQVWIDNVRKALKTKSAKKLLKIIEAEKDFTSSWWRGLMKMTYKQAST